MMALTEESSPNLRSWVSTLSASSDDAVDVDDADLGAQAERAKELPLVGAHGRPDHAGDEQEDGAKSRR